MNIYLVVRTTPTRYDEYNGFVLRADNEVQALCRAIDCAMPDWLIPSLDEEWENDYRERIKAQFDNAEVTLVGTSLEDEPILILADYLHG